MPNHCTNEIYFTFKTVEDKDRFLKMLKVKMMQEMSLILLLILLYCPITNGIMIGVVKLELNGIVMT